MRRLDFRTLVNMGRKAGLHTSELYDALAGRQPLPHEAGPNGRDGNGFRASYDVKGHQIYLPENRASS